ncbi:MAG: hypothetical protein KJO06_08905 [Gemmatimonadetes bacterium]|nr:hypothetical protein [Gemmatimonadota bacterium]
MKRGKLIITAVASALLLAVGTAWAAKGGIPGKPPKDEEPPPPPVDVDGDFWFWRWGHMDGPHDSSMALGISRDGKTAVGSTVVVDFDRAWRSDIDWAIATDDGVPPLYNELQVQEDIGVIAPSRPSAAFGASDMTTDPCPYDKLSLNLDWCGSKPVGTYVLGTVSYGVQWLLPVLDSVDEGDYVTIPDFGGGASDMQAMDVTADGLIMVGYGNNKRGPLAFYADMTDPLLPVVKALTITDSISTQTLQWSRAEAVSADGIFVAGYGGTKRGNRAFVTEVLDASTDPITLLSVVLPNLDGGQWSEAYAMTPDGRYIAGRSDSPKGPQACIWFQDAATLEWVVKGLGGLSNKKVDSVATGIAYRIGSDAGDLMVVGRSKSILYPSEAFVWAGNPVLEDDEIGYMYDLEYILTKTGVGELSGMGSRWILQEATGVSALGDRIVGWGVNPEGGIEAWVVTGYPFHTPVFTHE